ncbi:MAG: DUF4129 domain-containing protein [Planctomycetota bacterium]|nr:DUF4129 domain-containing protein [Planctomycetota bacterium]
MSVRKGLRPLGITAILDEATRLVRRRPGLYYSLTLPVMIPFFFAVVSFFRYIYWFNGPHRLYEGGLFIRAFFLALCFCLRFLSHGALCHAMIADLEGRPVTAWQSWKASLWKSIPLLFGGLALWALAAAGTFIFIIPGIYFAALLAGFPFFVMSDNRSHFSMLLHSFRASNGLILKTLEVHFLIGLGAFMAAAAASLTIPFLFWLSKTFFAIDSTVINEIFSFSNPVYGWGLLVFVWVIFEPIRVLAQLRLNLDGKIRREGYDLLDRVTRLTGINMRQAGAIFLAATISLCALGRVEAEELSPAEFRSRIQNAKELIDEQLDEIARGNDVKTKEVLAACQSLDNVTVTFKKQSIDVQDPAWARLTEDIHNQFTKNQEKRLLSIKKRLDYLEQGLGQLYESAEPSAKSDKEIAAEILSQNRFRRRKANAQDEDLGLGVFDSWLSRLSNRISAWEWPSFDWMTSLKNWIKSLWNNTPNVNGNWKFDWDGWGTSIVAIILTLIMAIVGWILVKKYVLPEMKGTEALAQVNLGRNLPQEPVVAYESTEESWRGDARRFASQGQFDYAVRSSYAGLLLSLNSKGWIEYDKTRTNWEYQREVKKKNKAMGKKLEPLTKVFDEKWYGRKDCQENDYQGFREELDGVLKDLEGRPENG